MVCHANLGHKVSCSLVSVTVVKLVIAKLLELQTNLNFRIEAI